ncbi:MAG: OadG family transporter subunit [Betaproteobacteria bacterium]
MENLDWGIKMTVLGMGLVFALLGLLWVLLTVVLMLDKEEIPEDETADAGDDAPQAAAAGIPANLVSAIVIAALKHKKSLRGGAPMMQTTWSGSQSSLWAAAGRARQTNTWTSRGK